MIDIFMALDHSVSPHTGVRTIQNTGFFWQADPSLLPFFGTQLRRQNFNLAPTQYRQLRRLVKAWSEDIEAKLVKFEQSVNNVEKITKEIKRKGMEEEKQAELKFVAQMKEK